MNVFSLLSHNPLMAFGSPDRIRDLSAESLAAASVECNFL